MTAQQEPERNKMLRAMDGYLWSTWQYECEGRYFGAIVLPNRPGLYLPCDPSLAQANGFVNAVRSVTDLLDGIDTINVRSFSVSWFDNDWTHARASLRAKRGTIQLRRPFSRYVILHELAHLVSWKERDAHGLAWREAFAALTSAVFGPAIGDGLRNALNAEVPDPWPREEVSAESRAQRHA